MSIEDNMVNVEFFGDHTQEDLIHSDCYLFSKELMSKLPRNNKDLSAALKVTISSLLLSEFPSYFQVFFFCLELKLEIDEKRNKKQMLVNCDALLIQSFRFETLFFSCRSSSFTFEILKMSLVQ